MKRNTSYWLSIVLAVIPLALIAGINFALYEYAGVGVKRDFYAMLRSDEALYESVMVDAAPGEAASAPEADSPEPRWRGAPDDRLALTMIGTSPSMRDVFPRAGTRLREELFIDTYNFGENMYPITRYYDALTIFESLMDIDIVVVEYAALLTSDYHLALRERCGTGTPWQGEILNDEIIGLLDALRLANGAEPYPIEGDPAERFSVQYDKVRRVRTRVLRDLLAPRYTRESRPFQSHSVRWRRELGIADISLEDSPLQSTNYLALKCLEMIHARCRANGQIMIVWVPPSTPELRDPTGANPSVRARRMADSSLAALRFAAARHQFKVFDYDAWEDDTQWYADSVHLNQRGAERFSPQFFADLFEYLSTEGADLSYQRFEP